MNQSLDYKHLSPKINIPGPSPAIESLSSSSQLTFSRVTYHLRHLLLIQPTPLWLPVSSLQNLFLLMLLVLLCVWLLDLAVSWCKSTFLFSLILEAVNIWQCYPHIHRNMLSSAIMFSSFFSFSVSIAS